MMYSVVVAACLALATAMPAASDFSAWKKAAGRKLGSPEEESVRENIFRANVQVIDQHNAEAAVGKHTFTMGLGPFTDMTTDEWQAIFLNTAEAYAAYSKRPRNEVHLPERRLDDSVNWVTKGAVTPVKNQQQCGSCWAFSTTGAVEGAEQIATGKLTSFSEQQLIDCSSSYGNAGCNGGLMVDAFKYIIDNGGIATESDYPYTGHKTFGKCMVHEKPQHDVAVSSYTDVPQNNPEQLKQAVSKGPVSIAIEADKQVFQMYRSGVLTSKACGTKLDHGMLIVGYGTENGSEYWLVKNSWGATWGEDGYVKLGRDSGNKKGVCGIHSVPSYPAAERRRLLVV